MVGPLARWSGSAASEGSCGARLCSPDKALARIHRLRGLWSAGVARLRARARAAAAAVRRSSARRSCSWAWEGRRFSRRGMARPVLRLSAAGGDGEVSIQIVGLPRTRRLPRRGETRPTQAAGAGGGGLAVPGLRRAAPGQATWLGKRCCRCHAGLWFRSTPTIVMPHRGCRSLFCSSLLKYPLCCHEISATQISDLARLKRGLMWDTNQSLLAYTLVLQWICKLKFVHIELLKKFMSSIFAPRFLIDIYGRVEISFICVIQKMFHRSIQLSKK
ncbi:uncharacterized protein LOC123443304 isoform X2 [Hordeum vulgare subsp. vulgare]|uniref:uncharacterized protein LOC123443304 isoform X2 n=1 Tax=Hordeum vulgare subsp. vulgare TaxID=112509 RepID=UPI001D1A3315|nr:uncharacterized protein LOC123443304 isoform X2 [Hordeum vulgare subsp. vulgare]